MSSCFPRVNELGTAGLHVWQLRAKDNVEKEVRRHVIVATILQSESRGTAERSSRAQLVPLNARPTRFLPSFTLWSTKSYSLQLHSVSWVVFCHPVHHHDDITSSLAVALALQVVSD